MKNCIQTNIPQVETSETDCEYLDSDCVIHKEAISYLGLPENSSITTIVEALVNSLIDARNRIQILETE